MIQKKKGGSAFPGLGQILLLGLFVRLSANFTLKFRLWSSPCSAELCEEKDLPLFYYVPYCSPLRQLQSSYLSGNLEASIDVSGIKAGQTKKSTWPIALGLSPPVASAMRIMTQISFPQSDFFSLSKDSSSRTML